MVEYKLIAQKGRQGLAPALGVAARFFKILLEAQPDVLEFRAGGDKLADRFDHGKVSAAVGAFFGYLACCSLWGYKETDMTK